MRTVKNLTVKVTYRVGLGDVEMPQGVYDKINEAADNGDKISISGMSEYPEALEWLSSNICEGDCMDWVAEIEDIS
jgi:hypothetical protein